jgi:anti-sigma-K factor RskA
MIDRDDIEGLAAEYVLGTLSRDERDAITAARMTDTELDAAIGSWENRLSPLVDAVPEAAPPPGLFARIERRIYGATTTSGSMSGWRNLAIAASVAFVVVTGALIYQTLNSAAPPQLVAVLQKDGTGPAFLVGFNEKTNVLTVRTVAANAPSNKSYELWLVPDGKAPQSLGVVASDEQRSIKIEDANVATVRNATFAVTIEQLGGSPTHAPTSAIIYAGRFSRPS